MWSDEYYYFYLTKDKAKIKELTESRDETVMENFETKKLREFLDDLPELKKMNESHYENSPNFPWIHLYLNLVQTGEFGEDTEKGIAHTNNHKKTNIIDIIGSKYEKDNLEKYTPLLIKIASFLNWQLINEETDDGIEDFIIWSPQNES